MSKRPSSPLSTSAGTLPSRSPSPEPPQTCLLASSRWLSSVVTTAAYSEPAVEETAAHTVLPANAILCTQTLEQTFKPITIDISAFPSHIGDEEWLGCCVLRKELESDDALWAKIQHLPPFHVIGPTDKDGYLVAVARPALRGLVKLGIPFSAADHTNDKLWRPSRNDIRLHGYAAAERTARRWFVLNALRGIGSKYAPGLVRLYRRLTWRDASLQLPIEWAILTHDLDVSAKVTEQLVRSCVLLGYYRSAVLNSPAYATAALARPRAAWMQVFAQLQQQQQIAVQHTVNPGAETPLLTMRHVALLRGLLASAGGPPDPVQSQESNYGAEASASANLQTLCELLRLEGPDRLDTTSIAAGECLLLAEKDALILDAMQQQPQVIRNLPVRFPDTVYNSLPARLVDNLPYCNVQGALIMLDQAYRDAPWLKESECTLPLFLCQCASLGLHDSPGAAAWLESVDGAQSRDKLVKKLRDASAGTMGLHLAALAFAERCLESRSGDGGGDVGDFSSSSTVNATKYLYDFFGALDDQERRPAQPHMWQQMAHWLQPADALTATWLDAVVGATWQQQQVQHVVDHLAMYYWQLRSSRSHADAYSIIQWELGETGLVIS